MNNTVNNNPDFSNFPLPEFYVSDEVTRNRIALFLKNKKGILSDGITTRILNCKGETQSVWYSRDYIQTILNEIDFYEGDGVRIYFGEYDENEPSSPDVHPGQISLLMVPTRKIEGISAHQDIVLEKEPGFSARQEARERLRQNGLSGKELGFNVAAPYPPYGINDEFEYPV